MSSTTNTSSSNTNSSSTPSSSQKSDYAPSVSTTYSYEKPLSSDSATTKSSIKQKVKKFVGSLGEHPCAESDRKEAEARGEKVGGSSGGGGAVDFGPFGRMPGSGGRT